jgi:DNA ligase-1
MISTGLESFETEKSPRSTVLSIFEVESLKTNNIALTKAKKWVASIFGVFDDEIDNGVFIHEDLGEAVYQLDISADSQKNYSVNYVKRLLELNCSKMQSKEYSMISEALLNMSANERRWFIRYWLRTPRNGINRGIVTKVMASYYKKKQAEVKKHLNFNSVDIVSQYYEMGENPPTNLSHGTFVKPMLAIELPMNKWPRNKIVDYKYDGNRYQIHKQDESVIIFNRKGKIVTQQFPDVVEIVRAYDIGSAIFDGEIYPLKEDGTPAEHKHMGTRVHSKNVQEAMERVKVKWVIFDCLKWAEDTIMDLPYEERLERFSSNPNQAQRMPSGGDVIGFYNQAINDGFEGVIIKDSLIPYEAGKRSRGWVKYKPPQIDLDVVIISAQYGDGKKSNVFATFEVGVKSENGFVSIGSVGTGFSDNDLIQLTRQLRRNIVSFENKKYSVSPVVVLQVKADLVSRDSAGNFGLRFPRCVRIRDDKFVADINTLRDVEALE